MKKQVFIFYPFLLVLLLLLFAGGLVYGAVSIPVESVVNILLGEGTERLAWQNIVLQSRFPQAVTALLAGASLAVSGLLLQTLFRNPLAGPSILGISDGANLGVAAIMLYFGGSLSMVTDLPISGYLAVIMAAFSGAACILGLIIYFSAKVKNNVMLLIIGIMIGYLASSLISVLNYYASTDKVHAFVMWGLGNFSGVSLQQLPYFAGFTCIGLLLAILLIKPLCSQHLQHHRRSLPRYRPGKLLPCPVPDQPDQHRPVGSVLHTSLRKASEHFPSSSPEQL